MEIKLVRHCETEWNRLEKCQGVSDICLNANGIKQSNLLKECFSNLNIDLIFSSGAIFISSSVDIDFSILQTVV